MPSVHFETKGGVLLNCNFSPLVRHLNHWEVQAKNELDQPTKVVFGEEPKCLPLGEICWIFNPLEWISRLICCERHDFRFMGLVFVIEDGKVVCRMYDKHMFTEDSVETYEYVTRVNVNILRTLEIRDSNQNNEQIFLNFEVFYQTADGILTTETREIKYYKHDEVGDGEYIRFTETVNAMVDSVLQNYAKVFPPKRKQSFFGQPVIKDTAAVDKTIISWNASAKEPIVYQRTASFKAGNNSSKKVVPMEILGRQSSKHITNKSTIYEVPVPEHCVEEGSTFQFVDNFGVPINVIVPSGLTRGASVKVTV